MKYTLLSFVFILFMCATQAAERPNIVWIIPDDTSANLSCYGETAIETPNVDRLAARREVHQRLRHCCLFNLPFGLHHRHVPDDIGAHHHRSGRGEEDPLSHINLVPKFFQDAGYYTSISGWPIRKDRLGKTDYNFEWDQSVYDGSDWSGRAEGHPFRSDPNTWR